MNPQGQFLVFVSMRHNPFYILTAICALVLLACGQKSKRVESAITEKLPTNTVRYAKHFSIQNKSGYRIITLYGKKNSRDTTAVYILYDSLRPVFNFNHQTYTLKVPCTRIVALSSIYAAMLGELHALDRVVAIDNIDYINQPEIIEKHQTGKLMEVSKGPVIDIEKTFSLHPDMVLMFGMGNPQEEMHPKLYKAGIPVALIVDHLEETPLARAEWIKFIAAFAGKERQADSIFNGVEGPYLRLKDSAQHLSDRPKVLSELKYGDTWFVPGGNSFMSGFINDAGGDYAWKDNAGMGSLPLSFEQVYRKAGDAEVWINLSMVMSKKEMLAQEERYKKFKAFQNNRLYNNNKRVNAKGYSEYWETAMFHPDRVLRDLILIFHSAEVQEKDLYYYRKIR
jgi:iron complex transport system substrate-binding protein